MPHSFVPHGKVLSGVSCFKMYLRSVSFKKDLIFYLVYVGYLFSCLCLRNNNLFIDFTDAIIVNEKH